jgi:hypothetical protein
MRPQARTPDFGGAGCGSASESKDPCGFQFHSATQKHFHCDRCGAVARTNAGFDVAFNIRSAENRSLNLLLSTEVLR